MEQTYLIELIRTLTQVEKAQILHFSTLQFINNGRMRLVVTPLLEICLKHNWEDSGKILSKNDIYFMIFDSQKFVVGKLEKAMVEAHKIIKAFLLMQFYFQEKNEFRRTFDFLSISRTRQLQFHHQQLLLRLQKLQTDNKKRNEEYYYQQYMLEYSIHEQESYKNHKKGNLNVPNTLQALEIHFYLNRLALVNRLLLQQKFTTLDYINFNTLDLDTSAGFINYLSLSPALNANFAIYNLLKKENPDENDIRSLFDLLLCNEEKLDEENLREFYAYLRNICVLVLSADIKQIEVDLTLHDLFKDNLARNFLHYDGKLHPSSYWAVSSNAIRVKDFLWALEFIERYRYDVIGENEKHDIYRMNLANYLFGIGQFIGCLDNIPDTSPFVDYLLHGKRLELKALFELKSELLPYRLDSFKMF